MRLLNELGFDGVDAGPLDESWRQQPGMPVYSADLDAPGVRRALYEARRERREEFRATPHSPGTWASPESRLRLRGYQEIIEVSDGASQGVGALPERRSGGLPWLILDRRIEKRLAE